MFQEMDVSLGLMYVVSRSEWDADRNTMLICCSKATVIFNNELFALLHDEGMGLRGHSYVV